MDRDKYFKVVIWNKVMPENYNKKHNYYFVNRMEAMAFIIAYKRCVVSYEVQAGLSQAEIDNTILHSIELVHKGTGTRETIYDATKKEQYLQLIKNIREDEKAICKEIAAKKKTLNPIYELEV